MQMGQSVLFWGSLSGQTRRNCKTGLYPSRRDVCSLYPDNVLIRLFKLFSYYVIFLLLLISLFFHNHLIFLCLSFYFIFIFFSFSILLSFFFLSRSFSRVYVSCIPYFLLSFVLCLFCCSSIILSVSFPIF